ncbi:4HBT domain-containing protein [Rhizoctonia solani AG-1 IA]|uniref:4HBT domain-containing protein n=1 Tax=Thanatephorus cucumeris (strain AG1-IA) TaxID=983506 RepID=L8X185_THACA|nr:4HBT domain-containing protein [Rhizoctonia solani AG-1 IA]
MTLPTRLTTIATGIFGATGRFSNRATLRHSRNTPINNYSTHSHNHSHLHSHPHAHSQSQSHGSRIPKKSRGAAGSASYVAGSLYPPTTLQLINPPPAPPAPALGSQEAEIYLTALEEKLQSLPLVGELRQRQGWYESRPYQNYPEERRRHSLTSGTLRGPVFAKDDESEAIAIIHVGRSLCGHDGIIHGGLLATLLDETLARNVGISSALLNLPAKVGVTANLSVNYRAPARADQFIVIHTHLDKVNGRKATVSGTVTSLETKEVLTEATALFVQPKYAHLLSAHGEVEKLLGSRNTASQEVGPDRAKKPIKVPQEAAV